MEQKDLKSNTHVSLRTSEVDLLPKKESSDTASLASSDFPSVTPFKPNSESNTDSSVTESSEESRKDSEEAPHTPFHPLHRDCYQRCNPENDPCCPPLVKPGDPDYLTRPKPLPDCQMYMPVERFEDVTRRKAYMKNVLEKEMSEEHPIEKEEPPVEEEGPDKELKAFHKKHPEITRSLDFLKSHPEFEIAGPNPMRIPHDELIKAMDGFTNMQLAHEMAVNHDFRLERYKPEEESLEARVRTAMKQAYWDQFDEGLSSTPPNYHQAIGVFREVKAMLLNLLLPHNQGMRARIERGLDEKEILDEIRLDILDFHTYSNFIIETLGQLCCPIRDKEIFALKSLKKPSEIFKGILEVMEDMQMDMANFLLGQFRPTIVTNCVGYERLKFAQFIEVEYQLHEDALRVTRSWILRHRIEHRTPGQVVGHAFGELLLWREKEWPETLTLDWIRYTRMAEEAQRVSYLGAAIHSLNNVLRRIFDDDDENGKDRLKTFPVSKIVRDKMELDGDILLRKEDMADEKKRNEALELMAAQSIKVTDDHLQQEYGRDTTPLEKDTIRRAVVDSGRPDNVLRPLLIRRMQEHAAKRVATSGNEIAFPKALLCIQNAVLAILVEFHRIAMHNRAVFYDLYKAIVEGEVSRPKFMNENNGEADPMLQKTVDILRREPSKKLIVEKVAKNEKLEQTLDKMGAPIVEVEDGPVVETTPEIEAIIDKIIERTTFEEDYKDLDAVTKKQAAKLFEGPARHDSAAILRQMKREDEAHIRIQEKKDKMRKELREVLRQKMGLPMFHKVLNKEPKVHDFCKLMKVMAKEEEAKKNPNQPRKLLETEKSETVTTSSSILSDETIEMDESPRSGSSDGI